MKRLVTMMLLLALVGAGIAIAADSPEVIVFENKQGAITFPHKAHQDRLNGECTACHEGTPAKFGINKEFGHSTCKSCHKEQGVSTSCKVCHSGEKQK